MFHFLSCSWHACVSYVDIKFRNLVFGILWQKKFNMSDVSYIDKKVLVSQKYRFNNGSSMSVTTLETASVCLKTVDMTLETAHFFAVIPLPLQKKTHIKVFNP